MKILIEFDEIASQRIGIALADHLDLLDENEVRREATEDDVKKFLITTLNLVVRDREHKIVENTLRREMGSRITAISTKAESIG